MAMSPSGNPSNEVIFLFCRDIGIWSSCLSIHVLRGFCLYKKDDMTGAFDLDLAASLAETKGLLSSINWRHCSLIASLNLSD
jgi:hypothetical protein